MGVNASAHLSLICFSGIFQFRTDFNEYKLSFADDYPADIYLLKVNNRNTRTRCKIYSKLRSAFIVSFEHISYLILVFPCKARRSLQFEGLHSLFTILVEYFKNIQV